MESVINKLFNNRRKSSKLGIFCRKSRQTPAVIELPAKDVEKDTLDVAVVVSRPPPDVRLVLFRECGDTSDRKLLFDSKSFELEKRERKECRSNGMISTQHGLINNNPRSQNCWKSSCLYQYVRGPQDSDILSEMLFGSVGMASRASSLKVHIFKEPSQLMLSRVFCIESMKDTTVSLDRGMEYHLQNNRPNAVLSRRKAKTLPVPTPETPHIPPPAPISLASSLTSRITRSDSSSSLMSLTSMLGASFSATGSLGSRSSPQSIPGNMRAHSLPPATRQASRDSFTLNQESHRTASRKTKVKIGFAVIFQPEPTNSCEFQRFFFEHFPLIESYVTYLKEQVESALNNSKKARTNSDFVEAMMEALHIFTQKVTAVYSTPRLPKPVWSSLTTVTSQKVPWLGDRITVECFIADLTRMVGQHNTKNKSYFMSGLITSVLTHHLAWVNTMMPPSGENDAPMLAYNPLWAQLGDLYGAVGTPTKVAKTVVIGEIHELVSTVISILSYFIRCSHINEVVKVPDEITPQTFLNEENLEMSCVPSELESDYVLVSHLDDQSTMTKSMDHEKPSSPQTSEIRKAEPINVNKIIPSPSTTAGSTLCRSRSSPGTGTKPQLKFIRQKSSGNVENLPAMRLRTNSNDTFAKPRGVQSRRTSHDVANARRMSQSSSALVIPDSESFTVSSLEGSKSLCMDQTPTFELDLLRKRLGNDASGSCPNGILNEEQSLKTTKPPLPKKKLGPSASCSTTKQNKTFLQARVRTHKRVSSEPFSITQLPNICRSSLVKTNSIYFDSQNAPVVRETFVDRIEPKLVQVNHVQRSQPVLAMQSPRSSPNLPRSKSSASTKRPIYGFKTSPKGAHSPPRTKHSSASCLPEPVTSNSDFKDVFSPKSKDNAPIHVFDDVQENFPLNDLENTSSIVRRSSSSNSGKMKLAGRRRKLTGDSQNEENDESAKNLPPLFRIPSISLQHEEFEEYFAEKEEEYIFFTTDTTSEPRPSSQKPDTVTPQSHLKVEESTQKSENRSTITSPPPLPSVGPCHRSLSARELKDIKKPPISPKPSRETLNSPKLPPPLPKSPPVHRGSLYPKLDNSTSQSTTISAPKTSIYPKLPGCTETPKNHNSSIKSAPCIYPKLDQEVLAEPDTVTPKLYPHLPELPPLRTDKNLDSNERNIDLPRDDSKQENATFFINEEHIPLKPVDFTEDSAENEKEKDSTEEEEQSRLTFAELLADYSPDYLWGFALHGTRNQPGLSSNIIHELEHSIRRPVLDEPVAEAVSIVADTDKWTVQVLSSHRIHSDKTALPALTSKLITNILDRITKLYMMKTPACFCLQQLENELGELVLKSRMLARYVIGNTRVKITQLSAVLGIESSDLPLLMAIASCHSPQIAAKLVM